MLSQNSFNADIFNNTKLEYRKALKNVDTQEN